MFVRFSNSSFDILATAHQNTLKTIIDTTQKETAIDQQQHSCEKLICQCHQTILKFLCPLLPQQAHGCKFANFIVRPRMSDNFSAEKTS
jgi:hypothetical protein